MQQPKNILFFDGECNLCNGFVDFLIKRLKKSTLYFASLQGPQAKEYLAAANQLDSVVYLRRGKLYKESDAAIYALSDLSRPWSLIRVLFVLPRAIRDAAYRYVARHRYNWFGKQSCRVPTEAEKDFFL